MSVLITILLFVLIVSIWVIGYRVTHTKSFQAPPMPIMDKGDNLSQLVEMMKEDLEKKHTKERDTDLAEWTSKKLRKQAPPDIHTSYELKERPIRTHGDLIQSGMSEGEKEILRQFYGRDF